MSLHILFFHPLLKCSKQQFWFHFTVDLMFPLHLVEKHCKKSCDGLSMMHPVLLYRDIKQEDFQDYYLKLWWQLEANNQ